MPRNRVIYQSESLYVGPSPATGQHFTGGNFGDNLVSGLYRIQNINFNTNIERTDINQFGELVALDRVILSSPDVGLDFSYIAHSLQNERLLGFTISSGTLVSAISGILNKSQDEKNYFIKTVSEGDDSVINPAFGVVAGIGNGFISSYSAEGSVGNFPTVTVNVEGLNLKIDSLTGQTIPAVNVEDGSEITTWKYTLPIAQSSTGITISALRPGDITVDFGAYANEDIGADISDLKIQSYNVSFDLSRENLEKLGSKFAFSKEISLPITVNASFTANLGDLASGNFVDLVNNDSAYDMAVNIYRPNTTTRTDSQIAAKYIIKNVKLDSQEFSHDLGSSKSVTLNFSAQVGGPQTTDKGLFLSGLN